MAARAPRLSVQESRIARHPPPPGPRGLPWSHAHSYAEAQKQKRKPRGSASVTTDLVDRTQNTGECLQHGGLQPGILRVVTTSRVPGCPAHTTRSPQMHLCPGSIQPPPILFKAVGPLPPCMPPLTPHLLPYMPINPSGDALTLGPVCNQGPQTDADKAKKTQGQHGTQRREDPAIWQRVGLPREHHGASSIQRMGTQ